MSTVICHTFSKLFQFCKGYGVLGKYCQMRYISERNHYARLETVEHVFKGCPLHPAEPDSLRKISPGFDPKILLDTKKSLGTVVKFLDLLPQLFC